MARPKLQTTRDRQFNIGLTASELAELHRAARVAGMRPVDYGRARLLSKPGRMIRTARIESAVHPVDPLVVVQLARIGNNLNQVARRLNELALPAPDDLVPLLAEIRIILRAAQLA